MSTSRSSEPGRPRVVVVGAGMAGLATVRALAHAPASVLLIDEHNYTAFPPLLFQVATCFLSPTDVARPIRAMLHRRPTVAFRMGRVLYVDGAGRRLGLDDGTSVGYDFLVLATGVVPATSKVPGAVQHAIPLKTVNDAIRLRNSVLRSFEAAAVRPAAATSAQTSVAVVGGGATGVELAGYIANFLFQYQFPADYPQLERSRMRVVLIEHGPRLLPDFHPRLSEYALDTLRGRGVDVRLRTDVVEVDSDGVTITGGERIPATTIVWAGGVEAPDWVSGAGLGLRGGRVAVDAHLQAPGHPGTFVVGDLAAVPDSDDRLRPQVAQVAIQTGRHAGRQIRRLLAGQPTTAFSYFDKGMMATIGRHAAVVQTDGIRVTGRLAWLAWGALHISYLPGQLNRLTTGLKYLWWHLSHENANRVLIEAEPRTSTRLPSDTAPRPTEQTHDQRTAI